MRAADVVVQPMIGPLSNTCVLIVAGCIDRSKPTEVPRTASFLQTTTLTICDTFLSKLAK
jgi:hypothetical protein